MYIVCVAMVRQTSLTSAMSTVGTCPDMCPEKERYRREDTHRLSWFEIDRATYEPRVRKKNKNINVYMYYYTVFSDFLLLFRMPKLTIVRPSRNTVVLLLIR